MSEHKCEEKVWGHLQYLPCGKTARYEHEGKWYCKTHHPPTVQEKLDARKKKWKEDWESQKQAMRKAEEARAEMKRRAAAYDGLVAQRDALLEALHAIVRRVNDAASYRMGSDIDALARAAIRALGERDWKAAAQEAQKHFDAELKRYEGEKE